MLVSVSEQLAGSNAPKHFNVTRLECITLETGSRGVRNVTCNIHPPYIDIALIILHNYSWQKVGAKGVEHVPSSQAMGTKSPSFHTQVVYPNVWNEVDVLYLYAWNEADVL